MTTQVEPLFYTVLEAAIILAVTPATMRRLLESREFTGRKIGGQWRLPKETFDREVAGHAA